MLKGPISFKIGPFMAMTPGETLSQIRLGIILAF